MNYKLCEHSNKPALPCSLTSYLCPLTLCFIYATEGFILVGYEYNIAEDRPNMVTSVLCHGNHTMQPPKRAKTIRALSEQHE